jgi:4-hydroxy-tetrahydrodipicolinate synthase
MEITASLHVVLTVSIPVIGRLILCMLLTTGIGSFVPKIVVAFMEVLREQDWERALRIRDLVRPYEDLREESGPDNDILAANNVPAIKYGIELAGRYGGPVHEPIVELSEENKRRAEEYYDRMTGADI